MTIERLICEHELEENNIVKRPIFMNIFTGSTGPRAAWDYIDDSGQRVNAVDLGEVVEVECISGSWVEL